MKNVVSAGCCIVLCCGLGFAQGAHKTATTGAAALISDQQFVDFAGQTDMMEANLGQLAETQASTQSVKDYALMLVTDHTSDYTQISTVAGKANLVVPKGLDAAHDKMIAPFKDLKGPAFDHRYIQEMIAGHTKAIAVYTKEAGDTQSADLKTYANETLPVLQKHLDSAKEIAKAKP